MTFRKAQALFMITILLTALLSVGVWADEHAPTDADYENKDKYPAILSNTQIEWSKVNWVLAQEHPAEIPSAQVASIPPDKFKPEKFIEAWIKETDTAKKGELAAKLKEVTQAQWAEKKNFVLLEDVSEYPDAILAVKAAYPGIVKAIEGQSKVQKIDGVETLVDKDGRKAQLTDTNGKTVWDAKYGTLSVDENGKLVVTQGENTLSFEGTPASISAEDGKGLRVGTVQVTPEGEDTITVQDEGIKIANGDLSVGGVDVAFGYGLTVHDRNTLLLNPGKAPPAGVPAVAYGAGNVIDASKYHSNDFVITQYGAVDVEVAEPISGSSYRLNSEEPNAKVTMVASGEARDFGFDVEMNGQPEGKPINVQVLDSNKKFIQRKFQYNPNTQRFDYEADKEHLLFDDASPHPAVQFRTEGSDVKGSIEVTPAQPGQPTPQPTPEKESGGLFSSPILWGIVGGLLGFFLFGGVLGVALGAVGGYVLSTFLMPKPSETVTGTTTPEGKEVVTSEITGQPYKCGESWCYTDPNTKEETVLESAKTYDDALKAYREKIGATKEQPEAPSAGVAEQPAAQPAPEAPKAGTESKTATPEECPPGQQKDASGECR